MILFDYEELEEIIEKITAKVTYANRSGNLEELLTKWELVDLIPQTSAYTTKKDGKIVVVGATEVKENVLNGIIKSLGLDKNRFEFCLDYDKAKTFQYKKLRYNPDYRAVIFGPVPHSSSGKNNSGSVIAEMQNHEGYPLVEVLVGSGALKITKSNFREKLEELIERKYI